MTNSGRAVTSNDVGRRAGVSRTTVSFVLTGRHLDRLSSETIERVRTAARELGYVPNAAARSLASGRTRTLALYVRSARLISIDMFTATFLQHLSVEVNRHDFRVMVSCADEKPGQRMVDLARSHRVDGVVAMDPGPDDTTVAELREIGIPVVGMSSLRDEQIPTVGTEDAHSMGLLADHFVERGFTEIGYIHYAPLVPGDGSRGEVLRNQLIQRCPRAEVELLGGADFSPASGYDVVRRLLARRKSPRVLAFGNDTVAIGGMAALREAGYGIPGDVAVSGVDDIEAARFLSPSLTTVRPPVEDIAIAAARELITAVTADDQRDVRHQTFPATLVVRESTMV